MGAEPPHWPAMPIDRPPGPAPAYPPPTRHPATVLSRMSLSRCPAPAHPREPLLPSLMSGASRASIHRGRRAVNSACRLPVGSTLHVRVVAYEPATPPGHPGCPARRDATWRDADSVSLRDAVRRPRAADGEADDGAAQVSLGARRVGCGVAHGCLLGLLGGIGEQARQHAHGDLWRHLVELGQRPDT